MKIKEALLCISFISIKSAAYADVWSDLLSSKGKVQENHIDVPRGDDRDCEQYYKRHERLKEMVEKGKTPAMAVPAVISYGGTAITFFATAMSAATILTLERERDNQKQRYEECLQKQLDEIVQEEIDRHEKIVAANLKRDEEEKERLKKEKFGDTGDEEEGEEDEN